MGKLIQQYQEKVLKLLSGKMDNFYLAGGTALSLYYFHHRQSIDLDFFTKDFKRSEIIRIMKYLAEKLGKKSELVSSRQGRHVLTIMVYKLKLGLNTDLKIDFVEDPFVLLKPLKIVNGIKVLSLEDIYLKKIQTTSGIYPFEDESGRKFFAGSRQEAKDFYDLYCLSGIFMKLSDFAFKYGNELMREAIIRWFRTYDRFKMRSGLLELEIINKFDYSEIERHFKKEIHKIITKEVESL